MFQIGTLQIDVIVKYFEFEKLIGIYNKLLTLLAFDFAIDNIKTNPRNSLSEINVG